MLLHQGYIYDIKLNISVKSAPKILFLFICYYIVQTHSCGLTM